MRSRAAIRARVQFQMMWPSPHSVILCDSQSSFPQRVQCAVSAKRMAANRSFVGTISWITVYHVDFRRSDIEAWFKLRHTLSHGIDGCSWVTRRSGCLYSTVVITCSTPYSRFLNVFSDSVFPGGFMYAIIYGRMFEIGCLIWDLVPVRRVHRGAGHLPPLHPCRRY